MTGPSSSPATGQREPGRHQGTGETHPFGGSGDLLGQEETSICGEALEDNGLEGQLGRSQRHAARADPTGRRTP